MVEIQQHDLARVATSRKNWGGTYFKYMHWQCSCTLDNTKLHKYKHIVAIKEATCCPQKMLPAEAANILLKKSTFNLQHLMFSNVSFQQSSSNDSFNFNVMNQALKCWGLTCQSFTSQNGLLEIVSLPQSNPKEKRGINDFNLLAF